MLLRLALARTVMLNILVFHPASLLAMLSMIVWKSALVGALWKIEKPKYLSNSVVLSIPRVVEQFEALWLVVLLEKKTLGLALLIFWPEEELNWPRVDKMVL